MKGSIQQRGKDAWRIVIYTGKIIDGKRERYTETVRSHRKGDAQKRLTELLAGMEKGTCLPSGRMKLSELLDQWLDGYVKTNCSLRTHDGYKSIIDNHLTPALGHVKLKYLQAPDIQKYYGQKCETLSARTVHHQHRVLSEALKFGVRQGYLGYNPCELVDPPSPRNKVMRTLTPSEIETLLSEAQSDTYYPIIYMAVSSGLRQAELLGLRWRDLHLDMLSLSVNQVLYKRRGICEFKEPKTDHSRRRVSMTPKLACFLKEYKGERESLYLHKGKILGLDDLVFSNTEFEPICPTKVSEAFRKLCSRADLKGVRFHDLRHTFASICLLRGVSAKVISEALGHSSVAFTLQVYSHIIEGMQKEAMSLLDGVLPEGVLKKENNTKLTPNHSYVN